MSNSSVAEEDFKLVSKKRGKTFKARNIHTKPEPAAQLDHDKVLRRVNEAREDLLRSGFLPSVLAPLREGLSQLDGPQVEEIVCLGIGRFGECLMARYQLGLLLSLRDHFCCEASAFDPIHGPDERELLAKLGCGLIGENLEGRHSATGGKTTIFYLPHCSKQLTNNLLFANWGLGLQHCLLLSNSFSRIVETHSKRVLGNTCSFLLSISPHTVELPVINTFKFFEIFNDTAVHVFPPKKLRLLAPDFWLRREQPEYDDSDVEFIRKQVERDLGL